MADIRNDVQSLRDFIGPLLPGIKFNLMYMPSEYAANEVSIEYAGGSPAESETSYHYRIDRLYQLVYFGNSALECVDKMGDVERLFNNEMIIPLKDSEDRYLRIDSFSLSRAFKTESGVYAIIGMLNVHLREARGQIEYPKIGRVDTRTYTYKTAISWRGIEGELTADFIGDDYTWQKIELGETVLGTVASEGGFTWDAVENGKTVFTEREDK